VITGIGLDVFGADFARLDAAGRLAAVKQLLGRHRSLLVWDNFESVREMPDPAGATPPLDEAECRRLREFLEWVRDHSRSAVIITSRSREDWLGQVRRIGVGGLNRAEAAQYAGHLLDPYPAAQQRRERPTFGELLEWLDGHPLAMRLTLPLLDGVDPAELLAGLRGTAPLPGEDPGEGRLSSLGACITYSFGHLPERARRLLPALSLFQGVADADVLTDFSAVETVPARFAGIGQHRWSAVLEDTVRVGLLTDLGAGMYRIHPALPGYLAAGWEADDPGGFAQERKASEQALCTAYASLSQWLTGQIASGNAALAYTLIRLQRRTLGAMLGYALDRLSWPEADQVVRALSYYWDARGLGGEADAWADRILAATADAGQTPSDSASSLWLYTTMQQGNRQRAAGQPEQAGQTYQRALAYLQDQTATEWTRSGISGVYHQLGWIAQDRGRLDEAEDWYRQSLAINEELGNRPYMALTYAQLGLLAEARAEAALALVWNVRCVALFDQFPSPLTGTGPSALVRLAHQLGMPALEETWQQVAGRPLPPPVRDYIISHPDQDQLGGQP
jgi:Tfp pilus assembly protein PilF